MHLLIVVVNKEEALDELITGWLEMGISGGTVIETTDMLELISHHVPIFAGFRTLSSGGVPHNRTLFTAIDDHGLLVQAVDYLKDVFARYENPHQGVYFVLPLKEMGFLGEEVDAKTRHKHARKKVKK